MRHSQGKKAAEAAPPADGQPGSSLDDDVRPADADRWHEIKRHMMEMMNGLELARIELESGAPVTAERVRKVL